MKIVKNLLVLLILIGVATAIFYNIDWNNLNSTISEKISYITLDGVTQEKIQENQIYHFSSTQSAPSSLQYDDTVNTEQPLSFGHCYNNMSERQKLYYRIILSAFEKMPCDFFEISKNDADYKNNTSIAYNGVLNDNPEIFWHNGTYEIKITDNSICSIKLGFCMDLEQRNQKRQQLEQRVNEIISNTTNLTDFEKEIYFYELICNQLDYTQLDQSTEYTAFGALVSGSAVCEGYTKAMQLLCKRSGIECLLVRGVLNGAHHIWNLIKLSDGWYELDVTLSDRPDASPNYLYFNATTQEFSASHNRLTDLSELEGTTDLTGLTYNHFLPKCDANIYNRDAAYALY